MVSGNAIDDWNCTECDFSNFARRNRCFGCKKARISDTEKELNDPEGPGSDNVREGDWKCWGCEINNFGWRNKCFKCGTNKDGSEDRFEFRNGDWMCNGCGTHNFARRSACFQCRKSRPDSGDWLCRECNTNNFARRNNCFGCSVPRADSLSGDRFSGSRGRGSGPPKGNDRARNGDWYCSECKFLNFARRDTCKDCGFAKDDGAETVSRKYNQQPGDWVCPNSECGEDNFAWRGKCFKCQAPKEDSESSSDKES